MLFVASEVDLLPGKTALAKWVGGALDFIISATSGEVSTSSYGPEHVG